MGAPVDLDGLEHVATTMWMSAGDQVHVLIIATIQMVASPAAVKDAIPRVAQVVT